MHHVHNPVNHLKYFLKDDTWSWLRLQHPWSSGYKTNYKISFRFEPSEYNIQDFINPICSCGHVIATTTHFLLHCLQYNCARQILFKKISDLDSNILERNKSFLTNFLLLGNKSLNPYINKSKIMCTIEYILSRQRFNSP